MNVNSVNQISNLIVSLFLIVIVSFLIARSSFIILHPEITYAITIDLTITLPFFYWLFIRKTKISKLSVIGIFTFGIFAASFILPENNRHLLSYLEFFVLPIVELSVLIYVGFIIYRSRKSYKSVGSNRGDFLENLRETLVKEFSSELMANAATIEISAFYYAFLGWKRKRGENVFTYHKKNGATALLLIIGFILAIETFVLHFLVAKWSVTVAWILTAFSLYFLFQIYAHGKAVLLRPIEISDEKVYIRCGLLGDTEFDLENVETIDFVAPPSELEKDSVKLSPLGDFTASNLKIALRDETVLKGVYGKKRNYKTIFLNVDDCESFKAEIEKLQKIKKLTGENKNYGK